jgi:hypothetical protein
MFRTVSIHPHEGTLRIGVGGREVGDRSCVGNGDRCPLRCPAEALERDSRVTERLESNRVEGYREEHVSPDI